MDWLWGDLIGDVFGKLNSAYSFGVDYASWWLLCVSRSIRSFTGCFSRFNRDCYWGFALVWNWQIGE